MFNTRPSHETEMRLETPCRRWGLACAGHKSAIPRWNNVGVDIDDGPFCNASRKRCVCNVIDCLDGSKCFSEQRDTVQVDVVGIGGRDDARSVIVRFTRGEDTDQGRE